ncbi:hypothetical protein Lalb_Chr19g0128671 [Lupinus albus]|uniref:Uncharacterized protein n=1 Tax=Lupinus albus TaxID=3870 RepID=A0A6A4P187_LUPAL|nr:hypothetical protein Lalb_Chr19g0128671 [Lupinus albus]
MIIRLEEVKEELTKLPNINPNTDQEFVALSNKTWRSIYVGAFS